ncbi:TniQ family protein [Burkholderiaceae bacterium DAT-1]|nr:TniQ family protein [Burkholderiaceae bacterium DAT-1]
MTEMHLWPAHPHPYRGELLSSWLVRLAHANGLKVQTFCRLSFGNEFQVWNRDIDRLAPAWLLDTMSKKTGTPLSRVESATLHIYKGKLFEHEKASGQLPWILPLQIYHRKRMGFGLQFCPQCLAEDTEPYFRLAWRVAPFTFCPTHQCMLHDQCPRCSQGVAFHRIELGHPELNSTNPLCICWSCGYDLRDSERAPVHNWSSHAFQSWAKALRLVENGAPINSRFDYSKLSVLHQMTKLVLSDGIRGRLAEFIATETGQPKPKKLPGRFPVESYRLPERHQAVGFAWWLLGRWPSRVKRAWHAKSLRFNWLLRDYAEAPVWYRTFAKNIRTAFLEISHQ